MLLTATSHLFRKVCTYYFACIKLNKTKMVLSLERWKGKIAVVTGASDGIGAAIAQKLVEEGLIVVGFARRKEKILELPVTNPKNLHALKVDVTNEQEILDGFKWIQDNLGPVHVLINNAGILPNSDLTDGSTESWRRTFDTNVLGLSIATREALKQIHEHNIVGHIIHINSIAGHLATYFPGASVYSSTKFAVTALTETLRQELNAKGSKTKVTSISPGYVKTSIGGTIEPKDLEKILELLGNTEGMVPEDIADAVVYVLSTPPHVQVQEVMIYPVGQK